MEHQGDHSMSGDHYVNRGAEYAVEHQAVTERHVIIKCVVSVWPECANELMSSEKAESKRVPAGQFLGRNFRTGNR